MTDEKKHVKGYCYLDTDGKLNFRTAEYIEVDNPMFWAENDAWILAVWKFDTANPSSVLAMFNRFKSLKLKQQDVLEFSKSIGVTIEDIKAYAAGVQPN